MITLLIILLPFCAALLVAVARRRIDLAPIGLATGMVQSALLLFVLNGHWLSGNVAPGESVSDVLAPLDGMYLFRDTLSMWRRDVTLTTAFGIDGASLPLLLLVALATVGAFGIVRGKGGMSRRNVALCLVYQGVVIGALTAMDGLFLTVLAGAAVMLPIGLIVDGSRERLISSMRRFGPVAMACVLSMGIFVMAVAFEGDNHGSASTENPTNHTFELHRLTGPDRPAAELSVQPSTVRLPRSADGWLVLITIVAGTLILLFPAHVWSVGLHRETPESIRPLLLIGGPVLGLHLLTRLALFLYPAAVLSDTGGWLLSLAGVLTALYWSLGLFSELSTGAMSGSRYLTVVGSGLAVTMFGLERYDWAFSFFALYALSWLLMRLSATTSGERIDLQWPVVLASIVSAIPAVIMSAALVSDLFSLSWSLVATPGRTWILIPGSIAAWVTFGAVARSGGEGGLSAPRAADRRPEKSGRWGRTRTNVTIIALAAATVAAAFLLGDPLIRAVLQRVLEQREIIGGLSITAGGAYG